MPFRTLLRYRNPDITSDLNHRLRNLVQKGVFFGGDVTPVAGQLNVSVGNLAAVGSDGMVTLLEGAAETVSVQAGFTQWVILRAVYVANSESIAELEVLTDTEYNALSTAEKSERIRLARVALAVTATEVTTADVSIAEADRIDPVSRSPFRGRVDDVTDLPDYTDPATGITTRNRSGDYYFVTNESAFYYWSVTATPQWLPIVSTASELELQQHRSNADDGTVPPDFVNAQHITLAQREAFDVGSASTAKHGSAGTDFGTSNGLVDAQYPFAVMERIDFTGLSGATSVQLSGKFYVGNDVTGTAAQYFKLSVYQDDKQLVGSDRNPIVVSQIYKSDNLSQLIPSIDADALGFYEDPWVYFNFASTADSTFSGSMTIVANRLQTAGTMDVDALASSKQPIGLAGQAVDVPLVGSGFTTIPTGTANVQAAFNFVDTQLTTLGATPNELSWYGFQPSPISTLTGNPTFSIWESKNGTHILLNSVTGEVYVGSSPTDAIILKGLSITETLLPRGSVAALSCVIKGKTNGHLFIDLQNDDGLDGVAFRYDSTNTAAAPDKIALSIQGNSGSARVFVNDYNAASPDRNFAVVGSGRFNRTGATYLQGIDLFSDATSNRILGVSEEADKKNFSFYSVYESTGAPTGTVGFNWLVGDVGAPATVGHMSETGAGYFRATTSTVTPTPPYLWTFGGAGTNYDIRVSSVTPGLVLEDSTGHDFRLGVQSNIFALSIDTDSDNARDANQHFDDLLALTIDGTGYLEQFCNTRLGATLDSFVDLAKFSGEAAPTAFSDINSLLIRQYRPAPSDILGGGDTAFYSSIDLSRYIDSTEVARIRMYVSDALNKSEIQFGVNTPSGFRSPLSVRNDGSVYLVASNPTAVSDSLLELFGQDAGGVNDIGMRAYSPGVRFESALGSETSRFRWGAYDNKIHLSIDTDDDGVQSDPSGHYDDLSDAIVVTAAGDVGFGAVPSTPLHLVDGAVAGLTYTGIQSALESSAATVEYAVMTGTSATGRVGFRDSGGLRGAVEYDHSTDTLSVQSGGTSVIDVTATTFEFLDRNVTTQPTVPGAFTETNVGATDIATTLFTIPANQLRVGSTIIVRIAGRIVTAGSGDNLRIWMGAGATDTPWITGTYFTEATPSDGQGFWMDAMAKIVTTGSTPTVQRTMRGAFHGDTPQSYSVVGTNTGFSTISTTDISLIFDCAAFTLTELAIDFISAELAL